MKEIKNPRQAKDKGEFLSPYGRPFAPPVKIDVPGFEDEGQLFPFILKVLAGKDRRMIREHLAFFLDIDFQAQTPEIEMAWRIMQEHPEVLDYAVTSMVKAMRHAADLWIDSGKSPTDPDVDTPLDRNVEVVLPRREISLFSLMDVKLFRRFPRYTGMFRDGTQIVRQNWPRFENVDLDMGLEQALEDYGLRMALYYFAELLNTQHSRQIARCDTCKAYFAYRRARFRTAKHGVFCPKHKAKGSMKRTESSRTKRLDTAAKAVIEWESRRKGQEQWRRVAEQVNRAHGTAFGRRWFSQNHTQIQERVEALRNAKR